MPGFTLAAVRTAVRSLIRDTGTTRVFPQDTDFDEPFIRQAVQEYSERKPRQRPFFTLQIQAGVEQYQLPSDWLRKDEESWRKTYGVPAKRYSWTPYPAPTPIITSGAGGFPPGWMASGGECRFVDDEQVLVIHPAPIGNTTLTFDYLGLHVVDAADPAKTTVKTTDEVAVEKLAAANVLDVLAVEQAFLTKYKLARGLEVDNSQVSDELKASAAAYRKEALAVMVGPVVMRG